MNAMILPAIMVLLGVFYVLFAAVRPPEWISHWLNPGHLYFSARTSCAAY